MLDYANLKPLFIKKAVPRVGKQPSEWKVITSKSGIGYGAGMQNISRTTTQQPQR